MNTIHPETLSIYSDMYKEVYGVRPRSINFTTEEELKKHMNELQENIDVDIAARKEKEKESLIKFKTKIEEIKTTCKCGWIRAFEYLLDAEDYPYDNTYMDMFLYDMGIGYIDTADIIKRYNLKEELES